MQRRNSASLTGFEQLVLQAVCSVPPGKVTTYAALAAAIGKPKAARAVGNALNKNKQLVTIPCHRVIRGNGEVGNYRTGAKNKIALLVKEGVACAAGKVSLTPGVVYEFKKNK